MRATYYAHLISLHVITSYIYSYIRLVYAVILLCFASVAPLNNSLSFINLKRVSDSWSRQLGIFPPILYPYYIVFFSYISDAGSLTERENKKQVKRSHFLC
jgi:hypothetical protein